MPCKPGLNTARPTKTQTALPPSSPRFFLAPEDEANSTPLYTSSLSSPLAPVSSHLGEFATSSLQAPLPRRIGGGGGGGGDGVRYRGRRPRLRGGGRRHIGGAEHPGPQDRRGQGDGARQPQADGRVRRARRPVRPRRRPPPSSRSSRSIRPPVLFFRVWNCSDLVPRSGLVMEGDGFLVLIAVGVLRVFAGCSSPSSSRRISTCISSATTSRSAPPPPPISPAASSPPPCGRYRSGLASLPVFQCSIVDCAQGLV